MTNPNALAGLKAYIASKINGVSGGDPTIPVPGKQINVDKTALDKTADIRDSIAALVGSGYKGGVGIGPDVRAHVLRITQSLPISDAQNLLTHIAVQNQSPDNSNLNPVQRLQRFYDIQSSNSATNDLLRRVKAFGSGPISSFKETPELLNQQLATIVKK